MTADSLTIASARSGETTRCAHCDLPVPAGLIDESAERQFCCAGCRAVYETLHACGLESYYRLRAAADASPAPVSTAQSTYDAFDDPAFHAAHIQVRPDGLASIDLVLEGVQCAACVWLLERLPRVCDGVIEARLSLREATLRVTWDPKQVPLSRIARTLAQLGYTPHPSRGESARDLHRRETRRRLIHLGVAGAIMGNTMLLALAIYAGGFGHMERQYLSFFRWISAGLGTLSLAWPGAVFFRSALAALRTRAVNLDVPIALALLVGGIAGLVNVILNRGEIYFDSLTVLVFLLLVGRFIQYRQQRRAQDAVGLLFSLTPATCRIIRDGRPVESPIEALNPADLVEVRPGELFPADGQVELGDSTVNQSLLTGESAPVAVSPGRTVHAGAQNVASPLRIRITRTGRDTRVGRLMTLIERGVQEKPQIVQFADRAGTWLLAAITLAAAGTFIYWSRINLSDAIDHTVALLIVTCPCVLGLATPLTLAMAIGRLARRDILVKSAVALEKLSRGGKLFLDKTGTLTAGSLRLIRWIGDETIRPAVGALESRSIHPVARILHAALAPDDNLEVTDLVEKNDGGIGARVNGQLLRAGSPRYLAAAGLSIPPALLNSGATVFIARDDRVIAAALLGDELRPDTVPSVQSLQQSGWQTEILSGDAPDVVAAVASAVGIASAQGALSPEEKLARIRSRENHQTVVMVGDGVNDAAALAAADVGIAVHGGAEASLSAADVYIARPGLSPLVELTSAARHAMRTVRRNLAISLAYNLLAGTLAALGLMTPLIAAILMPLNSATVMALAVASVSRNLKEPRWK